MQVRVLGSAAGGGFPQWNCGCGNCARARTPEGAPHRRSQESVAVRGGDGDWFLLNASPEVRTQLESYEPLQPRLPRHSPVAGIVLTNGDLDHVLGLLSLRESYPLVVYATAAVRRGFTENNVLYRTLQRFPGQVQWRTLPLGQQVSLDLANGKPSGLVVTAVPVPGKPPVHLESLAPPDPEDAVGLIIVDERRRKKLAYFSSFGAFTSMMREAMQDADCIFLDGTFWSSDELQRLGASEKRAEDMAHAPVGGMLGTLGRVSALRGRKVFVHVNNTNPMIFPDTPEAAAVRAAGAEVANDGLEIAL